MAGGLVALLDDVAVLARAAAASIDDVGVAAAKVGAKAAGVVIDDAAVTPQYVQGLAAKRELPIIRRIALGSLRNKFLIILPAILLLSQFAEWALTPILMIGGAFLCYEGAEKVWAKVAHHEHAADDGQVKDEKTLISGAVRTDLILSGEITVISLNEVIDEPFWSRLAILAVVALLMTVIVYGAVALIVKMDDAGLRLSQVPNKATAAFGRGLVTAMPKVLTTLTVVGTAAMLWVGGHIILVGTDELGLHFLYEFVHHIEEAAHDATGALGGVVGWLVNTIFSAILGLIVGAVIVVVMTFTFHRKKKDAHAEGTPVAAAEASAGKPVVQDEDKTVGTHEAVAVDETAQPVAVSPDPATTGAATTSGAAGTAGAGPAAGASGPVGAEKVTGPANASTDKPAGVNKGAGKDAL